MTGDWKLAGRFETLLKFEGSGSFTGTMPEGAEVGAEPRLR
ncbi:MAG: hypothetical protein ABIQ49_06725 [Gemmatimonadales bacterium]